MMKDDKVYLQHILDSIFRIEEYTRGVEYKDFISAPLVQDGTIRQIEIIGEATKHLSMDFRERYSHVPWKDIAGMRDKLIHDYLGVDVGAVWDTVKKDLPILKANVEEIMMEMD